MPRKCPNYRQHSPNSHLRRRTILTNPHIATRPEPCAQIEQPWILRPRQRRHASRSQLGYRQPRKSREGSFRAHKEPGAGASTMEKRGRPRKNGLQLMWMLERVTLAVYACGQAREAGEKIAGVKFVQDTCPWMPVSETEAKQSRAPSEASTGELPEI